MSVKFFQNMQKKLCIFLRNHILFEFYNIDLINVSRDFSYNAEKTMHILSKSYSLELYNYDLIKFCRVFSTYEVKTMHIL